jgi:uncharacterized BrkB/YihY/UPF0761 family membrane protein
VVRRVVVVTIVIALAGTIVIGTVAVIVIIIKITPAVVADAHTDIIVLWPLIPYFIAVIMLFLFFIFYRRIVDVIRCLPAFISSAATAENHYR